MDIFDQYFAQTGAYGAGFVPLERLKLTKPRYGRASRARGLFCAVFPYYAGRQDGNLSLYARGEDYHEVLKRRLQKAADALKQDFPDNFFEVFVDASPFPEVCAAAQCGLGKVGANGLLIAPTYGSFVFIGTIATDLVLETQAHAVERCSLCMRCKQACPVGLDKARCISHLTQKKGALTPSEQALVQEGKSAWGCDLCQLCCPENTDAQKSVLPEFRENLIAELHKQDLPQSEQAFRETYKNRAFCWRGRDVLDRNLELLGE